MTCCIAVTDLREGGGGGGGVCVARVCARACVCVCVCVCVWCVECGVWNLEDITILGV